MLICDICTDEIKRNGPLFIIPQAYTIPGAHDVCIQCNQKINISVEKIKRESMKARRKEIKEMVQELKDNLGNNNGGN